jgi:hypothetical protein
MKKFGFGVNIPDPQHWLNTTERLLAVLVAVLRIRINPKLLARSGTEITVSDPELDPKKICKKEPYFQAEIRWFHMIIHISHLKVMATIAVQ